MLRRVLSLWFLLQTSKSEKWTCKDLWLLNSERWGWPESWLQDHKCRRKNKESFSCPEGWEIRNLPRQRLASCEVAAQLLQKQKCWNTLVPRPEVVAIIICLALSHLLLSQLSPEHLQAFSAFKSRVFYGLHPAWMLHDLHKGISYHKITSILISQLKIPVHPVSFIRWASQLFYLWGFFLIFPQWQMSVPPFIPRWSSPPLQCKIKEQFFCGYRSKNDQKVCEVQFL